MVGEWGGNDLELASALLNLHQDRLGSDGLAIITSQQYYHLVSDPPLPSHSHMLSTLIHKLLLCLLSYWHTHSFFAQSPHIHACSPGCTNHRATDHWEAWMSWSHHLISSMYSWAYSSSQTISRFQWLQLTPSRRINHSSLPSMKPGDPNTNPNIPQRKYPVHGVWHKPGSACTILPHPALFQTSMMPPLRLRYHHKSQ